MLFNSLEYAIFFPVVATIYFLLPYRLRLSHLLVASCIFYMAFIPVYILILALTIVVDYAAGIWIARTEGARRRQVMIVSVVVTCLILFVFKYFYFFTDNVIGLAGVFGWQLSSPSLSILLPIGLSFHTFQSLSYVIEVYRGKQKPEHDFVTYATFVMFFPQLVAGPIERPQNLLHQFAERHDFDYERTVSGLKLIAWGLFKKVVIADRLALYVNDVYAAPQNFNGLQLTIATIFFAYQIYCDFSGYTDIARGSARVLGFRLMENFERPYHALSISDFWRRWHISLSSWLRDYVYFSLGGSRSGPVRSAVNLITTFTISGLWHGANWTYVVWGMLNGVYLVVGRWTQGFRDRFFSGLGLVPQTALRKAIMLSTTFALTCVGWVVFRAKSLGDAWYILTHFATNWDVTQIATPQFLMRQMPVAIGAIIVLEVVQMLQRRISFTQVLRRAPLAPRWAAYVVFVLSIIMLGVYRKAQFIYFQF